MQVPIRLSTSRPNSTFRARDYDFNILLRREDASLPPKMAGGVGTLCPQGEETISALHEDVSITDVQAVASYNWLDEFQPTILVPGKTPPCSLL